LTGRNPRVPAIDPKRIFAIDYAPLRQLLARSRAVVHAGGIGTTAETLRAGLPAVIVPFSFDQPDNAARVRRLGAGVVLDRRRISVRSLAEALQIVLDRPLLRETAERLSRRIESSPGLPETVALLERLALAPRNG
jgi:UDP:flavonoid glycosyltransferase YjiC (YdhE family)